MFDTVHLAENGGTLRLTAEEFFALPLSARIRHVIERTVTFSLRGEPVERYAALDALRAKQALASSNGR